MNTNTLHRLRALGLPADFELLLREALSSRRTQNFYNQSGHGLAVGDWVYYTGSGWAKADRDSSSTLADGIVKAVDGDEFEVAMSGIVDGLSGLTGGSVYYLSSTAGQATTTKPTSGIVQTLGKALSATRFQVEIGGDMAQSVEAGARLTGEIVLYGNNTAPSGWLLCDGAAVSRTTYADLFAVLGTAYGVGDGSTTFNLPNLKGRFPAGRDAGDTDFDTLGETGGAKTHTLTTAEMPGHNHGVTDPGHTHGVTDPQHNHGLAHEENTLSAGAAVDRTGTGASSGTYTTQNAATGVTINSATAGISTSSTGSGDAHENLPPYQVVNYIVKT